MNHSSDIRKDYSFEEAWDIYTMPLNKMILRAQLVHQKYHPENDVQLCSLLSVKTGGCKEDCGYCPQSAHYDTGLNGQGFLDLQNIMDAAKDAKNRGASRFCMGAAWRSPPEKGKQFDSILTAVREVKSIGLEVCTTLGMLTLEQAQKLAEAGVYAYNHNLDTSREYYDKVISTRTYDDRLETIRNVRKAGMTVCCGGIVGMGESREDRVKLLVELNHMDPHPESVPVNLLVRVAGTPLASEDALDHVELVRSIATARILMPKSRVRLSAGRANMGRDAQTLCFLAGANSIFIGDKLLTTPNPSEDEDLALLASLGLPATGAKMAHGNAS